VTMNDSRVIVARFAASAGVENDATVRESGITAVEPNPTPGGTQVRYAVARETRVRLEVLDVSGRIVTTLVNERRVAGSHIATWNGRTSGGQAPAGIYFMLLTDGNKHMERGY